MTKQPRFRRTRRFARATKRYVMHLAKDPEVRQAGRDLAVLGLTYKVAKWIPSLHGRISTKILQREARATSTRIRPFYHSSASSYNRGYANWANRRK